MSLRVIRGLPIVDVSWFVPKNIEETMDYVPHDDDIVIASYPKTGSTWLQYIVMQIITKGEVYPSFDDITYKVMPVMELTGVSVIEALKDPRIYKNHYPFNMVQKNDKAKYLYIYRKPEDTFISNYHFIENMLNITLDFDQFFENFLSGNIGFGSYFKHVLSYFSRKEDQNLLLISYEKLLVNRKEEILRIAEFFGDEYFQTLSQNEMLMEKIIERTSFDYMKKNLALTHPVVHNAESPQITAKPVQFFRKGIIGDGKASLSSEQLKRLRELVSDLMKGTSLIDDWID